MKGHYFVLLSTQKENKLTFPRRKLELDVCLSCYLCILLFWVTKSKQLAGYWVTRLGKTFCVLHCIFLVTARVLQVKPGDVTEALNWNKLICRKNNHFLLIEKVKYRYMFQSVYGIKIVDNLCQAQWLRNGHCNLNKVSICQLSGPSAKRRCKSSRKILWTLGQRTPQVWRGKTFPYDLWSKDRNLFYSDVLNK